MLTSNKSSNKSDLKLRINILKDKIPLNSILSIKPHGTSTCPFCHSPNKWYSWNNRAGKCYSTSCITKNKTIDIFDAYSFLHSCSFIESINSLESSYLPNASSTISDSISNRHSILSQSLSVYHSSLNSISSDFLSSRKFPPYISDLLSIGFSSSKFCLRNAHLDLDSLSSVGLFDSNNNKEYFFNHIIFPIFDINHQLVHLQGRWVGPLPPKCPKYKSTKTLNFVNSIDNYFFLEHLIPSYPSDILYICEGIPDCITLFSAGLPAVAIFGLRPLDIHQYKLSKFNEICFVGDNDCFSSSHPFYPLQPKTWRIMNQYLFDLQLLFPDKTISTFTPFSSPLVKDINDLLTKAHYSLSDIPFLISHHKVNFVESMVQQFKDDLSSHQWLWKLLLNSPLYSSTSLLTDSIPSSLSLSQYLSSLFF